MFQYTKFKMKQVSSKKYLNFHKGLVHNGLDFLA